MKIMFYDLLKKLNAGEGRIDIMHIGDDYGTQNGTLLSVPMWRKYIEPRLRKIIEVSKFYGAKVMLHSCGSVREIIPDLIRVGIDILDVVQPEPKGMDLKELKSDFGDEIVYHGTISVAGTLTRGCAGEVMEEVKRIISIMAPGGGFVLAPTHTILPETPLENIIALYETGYKYGKCK